LQGYIEDVRAGKRESGIVASVLDDASPKSEKDEAWNKLQIELHDVGIVPEWSDQDHGYIISTLRHAVDKEHLLQGSSPPAKSSRAIKPALPPRNSLYNTTPFGEQLTLPLRSQENPEKGLSDKEVLLSTENFPIPVAMELQDMEDTEKQALPIEDYPIPVAMEPFFPANTNFDKQVVPRENLPIPVESETSIENSQENQSQNSSSMNGTTRPKSLIRCKKPSIVKRMRFKLTGSKEDFMTLIQMGGLYSIKLSLDKGANVDTINDAGETALMVAVSFGHKDIVELLLEYGANMDRRSNNGDTALGIAALMGREDLVQVLLGHSAHPDAGKGLGKTALSQAAAAGHESIVRLLLDRGADPNGLCTSGDTALSRAAFYGNVEVARLLLNRGAEVDKTAYPRKTPLWKAVHQGKTVMVSLLMEFLADPLQKDVHGQSPLSMASSLGHTEMIRIFQKYGYHATPLQYF
jgi:ankyrin repeat protein